MINVLVNGSNGTMGKVLISYIESLPDMRVLYQVDSNISSPLSSCHSKGISHISYEQYVSPKPDVIIDFSSTEGTFQALDYASQNLIPIVIATTGFSEEENSKILEYAEAIPIFKASNMSYVIHLIAKILSNFSPFVSNMDIEIVEKHHNQKKDAPSRNSSFISRFY